MLTPNNFTCLVMLKMSWLATNSMSLQVGPCPVWYIRSFVGVPPLLSNDLDFNLSLHEVVRNNLLHAHNDDPKQATLTPKTKDSLRTQLARTYVLRKLNRVKNLLDIDCPMQYECNQYCKRKEQLFGCRSKRSGAFTVSVWTVNLPTNISSAIYLCLHMSPDVKKSVENNWLLQLSL